MSSTLQRRLALSTAALVALGVIAVAPSAPADGTAAECVAAGNVWVHVEYDETVTGACATEFATGGEAMVSAGLLESEPSWVTELLGRTAEDPEWWSLWTKEAGEDGAFGDWAFSMVGIADLEPSAGSVIGWRLLPDWNLDAEAPTVDPVEGVDLSPEPETPAPGDGTTDPDTPDRDDDGSTDGGSTDGGAAPTGGEAAPASPGLPSTGN